MGKINQSAETKNKTEKGRSKRVSLESLHDNQQSQGDPYFPASAVSENLRNLRQRHGYSLRSLAAISSLNVNTLSLIENGKTSPSVNTLQLLADALNVPLTAFFESDKVQSEVTYQKFGERKRTACLNGTMEDLCAGVNWKCGKPFLITLRPKTNSGSVPIVHTGYEFVYCLEGQLLYTIETKIYVLDPGDSLLFEAHLPHCWQNLGNQPVHLVFLLMPSDKNDHAIEQHFNLISV
jgi:transcriptional regulator with XRE-family HTH domain